MAARRSSTLANFRFHSLIAAATDMAYGQVLEAGENVVLSAPTGSGKTVVFELALIRMLSREPESVRAVYLAPTKALCSERTRDWSARFGAIGCSVTELTGDSLHGLFVARKSRLIVTTPEKWDSLTRRWDEKAGILSTIRLVLIDEVHILNESQRGARLEVIVTRIKSRGHQVRFVAVSATVPNLRDVATWIGSNSNANATNISTTATTTTTTSTTGDLQPKESAAQLFQLDETYRPCPLQKFVYGYPKAKDEFAFQSYLNHKLFEVIESHSAGRPCLIFCATRRSTVQAANVLAEEFNKATENDDTTTVRANVHRRCLAETSFDDAELQNLASSGVAIHHAGLSPKDRRTVEQAFLADKLAVLCCTTTLATGINLPAYCVIIRGTKQYEGQWCEMSELDLIQMMGRAGRPQFDRSGVAVIMCEDTMQAHYRQLVSGCRDIESGLANNLIEHVNAEVGLRGRMTEAQIEAWIRQSFMWTRLQKNPTYYLSKDEGICLDSVEEILHHLCSKTLAALQAASLVSYSDGMTEIKSTEYGEIMSRYFLRHRTMLALMKIPEGANTRAVLEAIAEAEEFEDQRLRQGEKGFLASLRTHAEIRYPPRQVARVADKVSLLIQAHLSVVNLVQYHKGSAGDASPYLDIKRIMPHAARIAKAAVDIAIHRRDGKTCKAALDLARSISAGGWDGSPAMLRQVEQIGEKSIKALANAGITTWQSLANTTPARVELILNRNPPFGSKVVAMAQSVPRIGLEVMQRSSMASNPTYVAVVTDSTEGSATSTVASGTKVVVDVVVRVENRATCILKSKKTGMALSLCILTLTSDGAFVDFRRMPIWRFDSEKRFTLHVNLAGLTTRILTYATCDDFAGTAMQAELQPIEMARGSHRTQIARAELQMGGSCDFIADPVQRPSTGSSQSLVPGTMAVLTSDRLSGKPHVNPDVNDSVTSRRCRHKCKGGCRHVCCRDTREPQVSAKPRDFLFQSRLLRDGSYSTINNDSKPAAPTTSALALASQKRKANEVSGDDDSDAPEDLLSRLDRLTAEHDRVIGVAQSLDMAAYSRDETASGGGSRMSEGAAVPFHFNQLNASHRLNRAHPTLGKDAKALSPQLGTVGRNRALFLDKATGAPSSEQIHKLAASTTERPAQRRFLKTLDDPPWLAGSDANG